MEWLRVPVWAVIVLMTGSSRTIGRWTIATFRSRRKSQFSKTNLTSYAASRPQGRPLGLVLDPAASLPLHWQIGQQVRHAILERRLSPASACRPRADGKRAPDVARGTALSAMDQLIAEGYVVAQAALRPRSQPTCLTRC